MAGTGFVLSGGGARGAYEAGVLCWVLEEMGRQKRLPPVHAACGTSVGAIHSAFLASALHDPGGAAKRLESTWTQLELDDVLRLGMEQVTALWRIVTGGGRAAGIFDATALSELVSRSIHWERIRHNLHDGRISALTVTATHVPTGRPVVFLESRPEIEAPQGIGRRIVVRHTCVGQEHVLASAAIPFVFPPVMLQGDLYCDGGLRLNTPMGPALRLGSERLFVIGLHTTRGDAEVPELGSGRYPGASFLLGKMLNAFLLDHVAQDLEQLERVNRLIRDGTAVYGPDFPARMGAVALSRGEPSHRVVPALSVRPSEDLALIASDSLKQLSLWPAAGVASTALLKLVDVGEGQGSDLASYLLFDARFARELIALGRRDAMARADEIRDFLWS